MMHRRVAALVFAVTSCLPVGCLSYVHRVEKPHREWVAPCECVQKCSRDQVYVFIIHGLDPCDLANLRGVRDFVNQLGFRKTYFGQLYHAGFFESELHRIHHENPCARFVLIGFSYGANAARDIAQSANASDIPIDLLVYLGGNTLTNTPKDQPENVREIVNILAKGCIWNGAEMDRAQNLNVSDVYHFGSPTHPLTLETLARELAVIAACVPVPEPPKPSPSLDGPLPPPRETMPRAADCRDDWDFLKPVARLSTKQR
jgi:hypothetical protein